MIRVNYNVNEQDDDALFVLTEEEQATMTEDEILERLEQVLAAEEAREEQRAREQLEEEELQQQLQERLLHEDGVPDWLKTRRSVLADDDENESTLTAIPLTTADEIQAFLSKQGGTDIVLLKDHQERLGGGVEGMILCTATDGRMIQLMVRLMTGSRKKSKQQQQQQLSYDSSLLSNTNDLWQVLECGNYIVHLFDASTRKRLNLEDLWTGKDPLWKLAYWDDDAIEEYCQRHPAGGDDVTSSTTNTSSTAWNPSMVRRLERYSVTHRPVIPTAIKQRDRRAGRRKRRELRKRQGSNQSS